MSATAAHTIALARLTIGPREVLSVFATALAAKMCDCRHKWERGRARESERGIGKQEQHVTNVSHTFCASMPFNRVFVL